MSDDDIQIIERDATSLFRNDDICQLCTSNLNGLTDAEREDHYREHSFVLPTTSRGPRKRGQRRGQGSSRKKTAAMKIWKDAENAARQDVFWYPAQMETPPDNYTPGVLSILKEALKKSHIKGATQRAVLCYERIPHIQREQFDTGWGCGYRNFLMTCAALMDQPFQPLYFPNLDVPLPPGVRNLQHWLEDAWKHGYDEIGARDFDHQLIDTKKKIGTGDLYVAFTSRRIPCMLVDFDIKKTPKGFDTLVDWVVSYFTERREGNLNMVLRTASPVVATKKMPVIMQYDGHSVTIVGYERAKNGKYNLLVFDPSSKVDQNIRQAALNVPARVDWTSSTSVSLGKGKRRDRSNSPTPKKRSRTDQDSDNGVVSIPDSDDEDIEDARRVAPKSTLDPEAVIKVFRLKKPGKKNDYQLLYFTMTEPLSDQEQNDRKVVFSIAEC